MIRKSLLFDKVVTSDFKFEIDGRKLLEYEIEYGSKYTFFKQTFLKKLFTTKLGDHPNTSLILV